MRKPLRLIVLGIMGRTPFAGVALESLHYLEGFRRLGHDVYYVEDTTEWPYDPEQNTVTADCCLHGEVHRPHDGAVRDATSLGLSGHRE